MYIYCKNTSFRTPNQMPFLKDFLINDSTKIILWKIVPGELNETHLSIDDKALLEIRKGKYAKEYFLAVRKLLQNEYPGSIINYDLKGKPFLNNQKGVSISHSNEILALGISNRKDFGIDIQFLNNKIKNVEDKFLMKREKEYFGSNINLKTLTQIWTSKEAIYKALSLKGVSFSKEICIEGIKKNINRGIGLFFKRGETLKFELYFFFLTNYILCYAEINKSN